MSTPSGHLEHGDPAVALGGEILRPVVGSGVHGIAIEGTDDHDEMGVHIEPPAHVLGVSRRDVPTRPELVERYGGDVTYGSHALLLAPQGLEIAETGVLTLPMPDAQRQRVLAVTRGEVPRDEVAREIAGLEVHVRRLLDEGRTPLPERADVEVIDAWAVGAHRRHWGWA